MRNVVFFRLILGAAVSLLASPGHVLADGLSGNGSGYWNQDVPYVLDDAESGDQFGSALATGDFDGDGLMDLAIGVPYEDFPEGLDLGAVQVFYGNDPSGIHHEGNQLWHAGNLPTSSSVENMHLGAALASGDFNGDEFWDLAIGIPQGGGDLSTRPGEVSVIYGSETGLTATGHWWKQGTSSIPGDPENGDGFGGSLAAGDFDGDGYMDLAVGVPWENVDGSIDAGALNIIRGGPTGLTHVGAQLWHQNSPGIEGACQDYDRFANALAAGDLNGDGRDDLAVGVFGENNSAGFVHVLYGSPDSLTADGSQLWSQGSDGIAGTREEGDQFGWALAIGDLNGDTYMDLAVGVPGEELPSGPSNAGVVNVIYGSPAGLTAAGNRWWDQDSDGIAGGAEAGDRFGYSVACGDFDANGCADLAIGVRQEGIGYAAEAGAVNVLYGTSSYLSGWNNQMWHEDQPGLAGTCESADYFGHAVACGDFNGDGCADLAVGVPGEDDDSSGDVDVGCVSVLYGSESPLAYTSINIGLPGVRYCSTAWGDYDGDGDLDVVLAGYTGSAYISSVYRNDAGSFTDIDAGLIGTHASSVAWGDYDNDGDLDILLAGGADLPFLSRRPDTAPPPPPPPLARGALAGGEADKIRGPYSLLAEDSRRWRGISRVYRNDAGSFTDIRADLAGVSNGSVAWGDYDNDGDLDILLTGYTGSQLISRVYRNDAGGFTDIGAGLPGLWYGSAAWGDYDNDGDLDIVLSGWTGSVAYAAVFRNDAGSFTDIGAGLPAVCFSSVAWGDYDSDGDLDFLLTGDTGSSLWYASVFRNEAGSFADIGAGLLGVTMGSGAWGDYDNDGDLDILLTGYAPYWGIGISRLYSSDAGYFADVGAGLTGVYCSSVAWGDYDNDGDLEILQTGETGSGCAACVCEIDGAPANTPPTAPTMLNGQVIGSTLMLGWDAATDAETPAAGLTYNLRVGTTSGGEDIMSAMADLGTGYRRIPAPGNTNHNTGWTLELPSPIPPNLYWSVQAVDACFAGSEFAAEVPLDRVATAASAHCVLPRVYALRPGAPNPFGWRTTLRFDLPRAGRTRMEIFDVTGRRVRMLVDGTMEPGWYAPVWDGRDALGRAVASGVYFVRFESGDFRATQKVVRTR